MSRWLLLWVILILACGFEWASKSSLVKRGNEAFKEKRYRQAIQNYEKAKVKDPDSEEIRYNLGTSLYELREYREADLELVKAVEKPASGALLARALYNYGNTQYRLGQFDKAIETYKKVLDIDPNDKDAKYNLEFLLKKKRAFEKKQEEKKKQKKEEQKQMPQTPQQQQQAQGGSQQKEEESQQEKKEQGAEGKQKEKERKKEQEKDEKEGEEQQEQQRQEEKEQKQEQQVTPQEERAEEEEQKEEAAPEPSQMQYAPRDLGEEKEVQPTLPQEQAPWKARAISKEDAMRILNALRETERDLQYLRRPPVKPQDQRVEKDW